MQHCKSIMPKKFLQGLTYNVRFTFGVSENYMGGLQLILSKINRIGDTK